MFLVQFAVKDINDLKAVGRAGKREQCSIVLIDDETVGYLDALRQHHFSILHMKDISDVKSVSDYPVVLCDIKGVGKSFQSKFEGAHIIEEIRKRYPEKIIIAFTAHQFDASYNQYFRLCDAVFKKDIDLDDWINRLDEAIQKAFDPVQQWYRLRDFLLARQVPLYLVFKLEQRYINSVKRKNKDLFTAGGIVERLPDDVKRAVLSFAASTLVKLIA